ncbi:TPA_asm: RNA chaperone Hfq, partial [Listeria monocytogenes]|nr:RNA chaperone Hfq [Listeria monocytogenes]
MEREIMKQGGQGLQDYYLNQLRKE